MMSALLLASARISKLWIAFLNHLLDGDLCKKFLWLQYSVLFWFSNMILSNTFILRVLQLWTQVMTSQIRSRIEYLIQAYNIPMLIYTKKTDENSSFYDGLVMILDNGIYISMLQEHSSKCVECLICCSYCTALALNLSSLNWSLCLQSTEYIMQTVRSILLC